MEGSPNVLLLPVVESPARRECAAVSFQGLRYPWGEWLCAPWDICCWWNPSGGRILRATGCLPKGQFILLLQLWDPPSTAPARLTPIPIHSSRGDDCQGSPEQCSRGECQPLTSQQEYGNFFFNTIMHFQPVFFNVPTHDFSTSCHHVVAAFCTGDVSMVSCPSWAKLGPIFALCSYFQITFLVIFKKNRLNLFSSCCSPEESSQLIVYM